MYRRWDLLGISVPRQLSDRAQRMLSTEGEDSGMNERPADPPARRARPRRCDQLGHTGSMTIGVNTS
jgi:hypothetical protein